MRLNLLIGWRRITVLKELVASGLRFKLSTVRSLSLSSSSTGLSDSFLNAST